MDTYITRAVRTIRISPKAILAFVFPLVTAAAGSAVAWIVEGASFDGAPLKIAGAGVIASGVSALGAWLGKPGDVVVPLPKDRSR